MRRFALLQHRRPKSTPTVRTLARYLTALGVATLAGGTACAQSIDTEVFAMAVPFNYDRGRNESVQERPRPEYDAIGYNLGGFTVLPSASVTAGYTDNVYQAASATKQGDGFGALAPNVDLRTNWSVHSLQLNANGRFLRYFNQAARNEDRWGVGASGRLDLSGDAQLNLGARTNRLYENQFSGVGVTTVRSARPIQATMVNGLADFKFVRVRTALAADYTYFNYLPVQNFAGAIVDQDNRDRSITRVTGHVEYGVTPDAGLFVELGYRNTNYKQLLAPTVANRDSDEVRVLGGISLDVSALLRGSLAAGYIDRKYVSPLYQDVNGFSAEGKIEYFPSELTTFTLALRRDIEDSAVTGASGYFNNGIGARVDHELLRYVILKAGVDYEHDTYRGLSAKSDIVRLSGGAQFLVSRTFRLDGGISYNDRSTNNTLIGPSIDEFRLSLGVTVRR